VRADFKYPLWRVEELLRRDPGAGPESLLSRAVMVADHVLVRIRDGVSADRLREFAQDCGGGLRLALHKPGFYLVSAPDAAPDTVPRLLAALNRDPSVVDYAEPDHILYAVQTIPNDPSFGTLWALNNTGQSGGTPDADIDAPEAWDLATGSSEVVAAVVDTGINYNHPDLASNIWVNPLETANGIDDDGNGYVDDLHGWDFVHNDSEPLDDYGHGSHVAGTIAASGNNTLGVAGVNWQCRLMALKFLDNRGNGTTSDAVDALAYATAMRRRGIPVRLTNNSWGGGNGYSLSAAIAESGDAGLLCVAAAGNDGSDNDAFPFYPASYSWSNIIAVAATDRRDALAGFSNHGRKSVDLAAPGVEIYSATLGTSYGSMSGTSMAAPHVAGVAALLWSAWPEARWQDVREAILSSVDPLPALTNITLTGGRLNAYKALLALFRILHTPAERVYNTGAPYAIDTVIVPQRLTDTNAIALFWNTDGSTHFVSTNLQPVSNNLYRALLPVQPEGTTISYWLEAIPVTGSVARSPTNAPAAMHRLLVTTPIAFMVSGAPDNYGAVSPDYGWYTYPSGLLITATAPAYTPEATGSRWKCEGWTGMGSVPPSGASNTCAFALARMSAIEWRWRQQYALAQSSTLPGSLNATSWWYSATAASTATAAANATSGGVAYAFVHWLLDGVRQPAPTGTAQNPIPNIAMNAPHSARAVYVNASLDADGDGMLDWWEIHYFGSTDATPEADPDHDGFSNLDEFRDRTDPNDAASIPAPPIIKHTPLHDPQTVPAPYRVEAVIADNLSVSSAVLQWSRNGNALQSTNMVLAGPALYGASIPAPGTNGDIFVYSILAADARGDTATQGPYIFRVDYPVLIAAPGAFDLILPPNAVTNAVISIGNAGTTNLGLSARPFTAGFADDVEHGTNGWTHGGDVDLWTLSTNRSASGATSWYCGDPATRLYGPSMHARLDTPPVSLGSSASMTFKYWIKCELDTQSYRSDWLPNHAWDGGIVEISTNGGTTFTPIAPVGGYPYRISGWSQSPWVQDTPCFAGSGKGWEQATFDLTPYAAFPAVIRFHFGTDDNTQEEGWYVDDVVITPAYDTALPMSAAPANLDLLPGFADEITIALDTTGIPTGDFHAAIRLACNAPDTPVLDLPFNLRVRSPAVLTGFTAAQTSTNGEGLVTIGGAVSDADGDTCSMELGWSTNAGLTWQTLTNSATVLANATSATVLTAAWNTSAAGSGITLAPQTLVRGRAWDGLLWSAWATSQPFMVDNEAPPIPIRLKSVTHLIGKWSTNAVMGIIWTPVSDGAGVGLSEYLCGLGTNPPALPAAGSTSNRFANVIVPGDGSNWWISARARDRVGNLSPTALSGPYWIDAHPPSMTAAQVTLALSPFGRYLIDSTTVTGTWSGFTDAGSGIQGYFFSLANGGGTTNGSWTTVAEGVLPGAQFDVTNTFHVWARDALGLIGPAAAASFLVLDSAGDRDGDGLSNAQEEIAGTDACNPFSAFALEPSTSNDGAGYPVLRWLGVTGRFYSLYYRDALLPETNWTAVPDLVHMPGLTGTMTYTDRTAVLPTRFYRITVTP
jgi:subtilisin family serine protease